MVSPGHPLNAGVLRAVEQTGLWTAVDVVASTASTNADLLALAGDDPARAEGRVLVAEEQTSGRGRLGRSWVSVPGASLTFSAALRPASVPAARRGWLPLLTGVAVAAAVRSVTGVPAVLKWPNDVLAGDRKLAGILVEQTSSGEAVVIGIGINVATPAGALPVSPTGLAATSLLAEGAVFTGDSGVSREDLLLAVLGELERRYLVFRADPDPARTGLLDEYRSLCVTLGRAVRVEGPAGRSLTGTATDIDHDGRLVVRDAADGTLTPVSAGDVVHVR
jgi:BirA family biotin operon repressor/biotin-[acetyl-CoA-carboxylase] ligase